MTTVLASIESYLNSRPLCALSNDITDLNFLTPSHLLLGRSLISLPEDSNSYIKIGLSRRWKMLNQIRNDFWLSWRRDYLQSLNQRNKWTKVEPNISVGSLVIIMSENISPSHWPIGRVIDVHPGSDGLIRVSTIKTQNSTLKRPIVKLILLPFN